MSERHINPLLKLLLEVGPIAVFFLAYRMAPVPEGLSESERQLEQILFSTKVFVPTILLSLAASYAPDPQAAEDGGDHRRRGDDLRRADARSCATTPS